MSTTPQPVNLEEMRRNAGRLSDRAIDYQIDCADLHFREDSEWNQAWLDILQEEIDARQHDLEDPSSGLGCHLPVMNKRQRTRARLAIHRIILERGELLDLLCPLVQGERDYSQITLEQAKALDKIKEGYDFFNEWARGLPL